MLDVMMPALCSCDITTKAVDNKMRDSRAESISSGYHYSRSFPCTYIRPMLIACNLVFFLHVSITLGSADHQDS